MHEAVKCLKSWNTFYRPLSISSDSCADGGNSCFCSPISLLLFLKLKESSPMISFRLNPYIGCFNFENYLNNTTLINKKEQEKFLLLIFYQSICTVGTGRNFRFVKQIADIVSEENLLPTLALASVNARWELSFKKVRSFIWCGLLNTIKKAGKIPTLNF